MAGNIVLPSDGQIECNVPLILETVGVPRNYLKNRSVLKHILPCTVETFSDGEIVMPHAPESNATVRAQFQSLAAVFKK